MDIEEIKTVLPHRYPFLLIDRVENIKEDEIEVVKNITINESFFQGHFPTKAVVPGVIILEAMAQGGVVLLLSKEEDKGRIVYLTDIEKAKFRKIAVPGDVLRIKVKLRRRRGSVVTCEGETRIDGKLCAKALFTCMIQ